MSTLIRRTFSVPPLGCNCSILGDPETGQALVVDPGGDGVRILKEIQDLALTLAAVVHTHAHFDHFLASGELKQATGALLGVHENDRFLWEMLELQCRMFNIPYVPAPPPDFWMKDGEKLEIGSRSGRVMHTPGHTPGSLCFYFEMDNLLLSGDTLFRGGIGRTDLWGGDFRSLEQSIREQVYSLMESTRVIPGHGPETEIGFEKYNNPFISV